MQQYCMESRSALDRTWPSAEGLHVLWIHLGSHNFLPEELRNLVSLRPLTPNMGADRTLKQICVQLTTKCPFWEYS